MNNTLSCRACGEGPVELRIEPTAVELLKNLVTALEGAYISSWQSTHAWQQQLDDARTWLNNKDTEQVIQSI
jgi:hypothetical protein